MEPGKPLPLNDIDLGPEEFNFFRIKIFELAGINLSDVKIDLVRTRLRMRVLRQGFADFSEYIAFLKSIPPDHEEWENFINLLTTNKTEWFREPEHFTFLEEEFVPHWKKSGKKKLSVWCAASSTGEEPYTLSLVFNSALKGSGIDYEIFATDIDTKVLGHAHNGVYPKSSLSQIPEKFHSGFSSGTGDISEWIKVKNEIRRPITFAQMNLTAPSYNWNKKFDLIMCRNVLIYFKQQTIQTLVENMYRSCDQSGILIVGHSESLQNLKHSWKYLEPSIYQKGKIF